MRKAGLITIIIIVVLFLFYQKKSIYKQTSLGPTAIKKTQERPESFSIVLSEQNGSGQSGLAIIEAKNDVVNVKIKTIGFVPNVPQPSHIHSGTCENPGEEKFYIVPLEDGESETNIIATWDKFRSSLPLILNVHQSTDEESVYTSCGEIPLK